MTTHAYILRKLMTLALALLLCLSIMLHALSEPIVFNGAYAQVCSDCGYTMVKQ